VWFYWSRVFWTTECFLQFPAHNWWIILDFKLLPCSWMLCKRCW
jgi:hypothetical protein